MRVFVELMHEDLAVMKAIDKYEQTQGRTPKKHEIVCNPIKGGPSPEEARRIFERLKHLEVVEHSRNGHCRLTDKGKQVIANT